MTNEEFTASLKNLANRIDSAKSKVFNEESTKMSFIIPLFQLLGYDVHDPTEFIPEFSANVGASKKYEKVDYAICIDGNPTILVEAKWCGESLEKHDAQLFHYFAATNAKFAILTNGILYRFFTDLDEPNRMDQKPFMEINMLELKESQIYELRKFAKENFDVNKIFDSASELKYTNSAKQCIAREFADPSDQFIRLIISDIYDGAKTQRVIDDFRAIVKKSFLQYVNDLISERLKSALDSERDVATEASAAIEDLTVQSEESLNKVVTTQDELQAFYIIKGMLAEILPLDSITYKDTESYFGILLENNVRKWICRLKLGEKTKNLMLPAPNNKVATINFENLNDLFMHRQIIVESANRFKKE